MDKCLDCGRPFKGKKRCRCDRRIEREVMDTYTFIIEGHALDIRATAR